MESTSSGRKQHTLRNDVPAGPTRKRTVVNARRTRPATYTEGFLPSLKGGPGREGKGNVLERGVVLKPVTGTEQVKPSKKGLSRKKRS